MSDKEHGFYWHFFGHFFGVFGNATGTILFWIGFGLFAWAAVARLNEPPEPAPVAMDEVREERKLSLDDIPLPWSVGALVVGLIVATSQATRRAERALVAQEARRACVAAYLARLTYEAEPLGDYDDDIPEDERPHRWHAQVAVKNPTEYPVKLTFTVDAQSPEGWHSFLFGVSSYSDSDGSNSDKAGTVDGALTLPPQAIRTLELKTENVVKHLYRKDATLFVEDSLAGKARVAVPVRTWTPIPSMRLARS